MSVKKENTRISINLPKIVVKGIDEVVKCNNIFGEGVKCTRSKFILALVIRELHDVDRQLTEAVKKANARKEKENA